MSDKQQTPSSTNVGRSLILIVAAIVVGTLWFVYQSKDNTDKTLDNAKQVQDSKPERNREGTYKGWENYSWEGQNVSFKHPGGWVTSETASMGRLYVKNSSVDLLKEETPEDFQQVWLSVDTDEASKAREDAIKKGESAYRYVNSDVKAGTVKSGDLTINTYEYDTVGGPTLEAYWTGEDGKRYFATTSTEVGEENQAEMVANLKKLLATVSFTE